MMAPTRLQLGRAGDDARAEQARVAAGRPDEAEEDAQRRRLARAVRAEQAADLALLDLEAQVVDREHAPRETLREGRVPRRPAHSSRTREQRGVRRKATARSLPWRPMHPSAAPQDELRCPSSARRAAHAAVPRRDAHAVEPAARARRVRAFVDRVVGSMWWHLRFPDRNLAIVPRLRPGNGARQAFYREEETGPTITLPRRYRTKGVVLHELVHFALGPRLRAAASRSHVPAHPARRHRRVLRHDHASTLADSYREHGAIRLCVHFFKPATLSPALSLSLSLCSTCLSERERPLPPANAPHTHTTQQVAGAGGARA